MLYRVHSGGLGRGLLSGQFRNRGTQTLRDRRALLPAVLLIAVLLAACRGGTGGRVRLPSDERPFPSGVLVGCGGIAVPSTLLGSRTDARFAWLQSLVDGRRTEVVWPTGYTASFEPGLVVYDENSRAVLRAGDFVDGGCGTSTAGVLKLSPPFLALVLDCGPMAVADCTGRVNSVARSAGWPGRGIARLRFLTVEGAYEITFDDGARASGTSTD